MSGGLLLTAAQKLLAEGLARLNSHGMLACECVGCKRLVLVETTEGGIACPHCHRPTVQVWCRVKVELVPEGAHAA